MKCPVDRGGCGNTLQWDEGAFCKSCMKAAEERVRLKRLDQERNNAPK